MNNILILIICPIAMLCNRTHVMHVRPIFRTTGIDKFMNFVCKPGERFTYGCTNCICDESTRREIICERKECRRRYCQPLSIFMRGCYPCTCQLNGLPFCRIIKCTAERKQKRTNISRLICKEL